MTTATDTVLDQQTVDELAPPCESTYNDGKTATHALLWIVHCSHIATVSLTCPECTESISKQVARRRIHCIHCRRPVKLDRIERL